MSIIRITLLALLGTVSLATANDERKKNEITPFGLNPIYGVSRSADSATAGMTKYLLWKLDDQHMLLDSIWSSSLPQLCDSNAVSYIVSQGSDSASLVVKGLNSPTESDTIITYPINDMRKGRSSSGQKRLYSLNLYGNRYVYFRPDSLLFWYIPYSGRSILEIGRILADGSYQTLLGSMECDFPRLTSDFSMALYCRWTVSGPWRSEPTRTKVWAYDFKRDSTYVLREVSEYCRSPQMFRADDQLYCIANISRYTSSVCIVEDSIPRVLFSAEYPVQIADYDIFRDSIVVRLVGACDYEIDTKTHVIPR